MRSVLGNIYTYVRYYLFKRPLQIMKNVLTLGPYILRFRTFDYDYNFQLFVASLRMTANSIEKNQILLNSEHVVSSIRNFCELYEKLQADNYLEETGYVFRFDLDTNMSESEKQTYNEYRLLAKQNREKDKEKFLNEFKKFETWWD